MTTTSDHYWETARTVCTPKELQALELRDRHHYGSRLSALMLGISREAVRSRLTSADRKIHNTLNPPKETAA